LQETHIANMLHKKTDYTLLEYLSSPPVFTRIRVTRSLVLCLVVCRSLFVVFRPAIMLSVFLRFTDSD